MAFSKLRELEPHTQPAHTASTQLSKLPSPSRPPRSEPWERGRDPASLSSAWGLSVGHAARLGKASSFKRKQTQTLEFGTSLAHQEEISRHHHPVGEEVKDV